MDIYKIYNQNIFINTKNRKFLIKIFEKIVSFKNKKIYLKYI